MAIVLKLIDARGIPIKGESKVPGHVDEIDVQAWKWGVNAPAQVRYTVLDVSIRKSFDLASPQILTAATTNELLQQGVLTVIDQQGGNFLVMTLKNISVELVVIANDSQAVPEEDLNLRFDQIEIKYKGQDVVVPHSTTARRKTPKRRKR
jgi:type VI secretion system Hcp family effector